MTDSVVYRACWFVMPTATSSIKPCVAVEELSKVTKRGSM